VAADGRGEYAEVPQAWPQGALDCRFESEGWFGGGPHFSAVPLGLGANFRRNPALKCRAIFRCPSGTRIRLLRSNACPRPIAVRAVVS